MAFSTAIKNGFNRVLRPVGLRVETLRAAQVEDRRLQELERGGHFERQVFPVPESFRGMEVDDLLAALAGHRRELDDLDSADRNPAGYSFGNGYFGSPDAEILYTIIRSLKPARIVEVGSGHSTRVMRQAIEDGGLRSRLISIDPSPRDHIDDLVDDLHRVPVESLESDGLLGLLEAGDFLFIDSSHRIRAGNDVCWLYLVLMPALPAGVVVHIHDVFLPYDYPRDWMLRERWSWNEQYLVQAMLMAPGLFDVLWAGYYLQCTRPDFKRHFPHLGGGVGQSLWLRKRAWGHGLP